MHKKLPQVIDLQEFGEGALTDSNRGHSEPQSKLQILGKPFYTLAMPHTKKMLFAAILRRLTNSGLKNVVSYYLRFNTILTNIVSKNYSG